MNYEIHLTVHVRDAAVAEAVARALHWKTSRIDGDPVLGAKPFFYLTTHAADVRQAALRLANCKHALEDRLVPLIREKIEHIIYDVRHSA